MNRPRGIGIRSGKRKSWVSAGILLGEVRLTLSIQEMGLWLKVSNIKYTIFNTHKRTSAYGVIDPVARMAINLNSNIVRHRTLFNYLSCNVRM